MKKIYSLFLTLLTLLCAGFTAQADSYTITFKSGTGTSDSSSPFTTSTKLTNFIESGADNIASITATNNVYNAKSGYGIKFSSSNAAGLITLKLANAVNATTIVVNAVKYGSDASSIAVNDAAAQILDGTEFKDYTFDINKEISEIKLSANDGKKRDTCKFLC